MKLQMKREALEKINRQANEMPLNPNLDSGTVEGQIGLLEQHPRWQVAYNQYVLHVGA
jgi:hypothetical protein